MENKHTASEARRRLVDIAGRTSQDLGASRITGQVLVYLYLQKSECSLDKIVTELGLSKASVSIAARQLENLGLIRQVWRVGDRKNYYTTAENIASALQEGLIGQIRKKVQLFGEELEIVKMILEPDENPKTSDDVVFLRSRVDRASELQRKLEKILDNPLVRFLSN